MAKRMLIDATHPEETRVVVLNGTRLEQFDVETSTKKQIKGNVYLAKVVRVEPSLQAAFVDYGGERHGFLSFSEIHPDYYQIPIADRQALLAEEAARAAAQLAEQEPGAEEGSDGEEREDTASVPVDAEKADEPSGHNVTYRASRPYKIQEVIKRRQIMLVQIVKEERGNKGAALSTYLSLAGRYCVLMPNTPRGGGVSRKITNVTDRKRLKGVMAALDIPSQMAVILRTAGQERSRAEIKRDYDYLIRSWVTIRDKTLDSCAPALVHEEGNLIKRAIRDIYTSDVEEILVDGDEGYRAAKDFMKVLTPSHARRVQPSRDTSVPLFRRYQVDSQLDAMHNPTVQLKSGGYIVINQTEALVAIDINSGRSTKERHIEETALKTNLEAAEEIARQLRLRDLAGLVVIDFIDMDDPKNDAAVERRLKDALRLDRARIQVGRISSFGLLELSRQRLRPSLMETSFQTCPHCSGTGLIRSVESAAIHMLRVLEEEMSRHPSSGIALHAPTDVALYILNKKRTAIADLESHYGSVVFVEGDATLVAPACRVQHIAVAAPLIKRPQAKIEDHVEKGDEEESVAPSLPPGHATRAETLCEGDGADAGGRKRRRRKRRRRSGEEATAEQPSSTENPQTVGTYDASTHSVITTEVPSPLLSTVEDRVEGSEEARSDLSDVPPADLEKAALTGHSSASSQESKAPADNTARRRRRSSANSQRQHVKSQSADIQKDVINNTEVWPEDECDKSAYPGSANTKGEDVLLMEKDVKAPGDDGHTSLRGTQMTSAFSAENTQGDVFTSHVTERTAEGEAHETAMNNCSYNGESSASPSSLTNCAVVNLPSSPQEEAPRRRGWWRR